MTLNAHIWQTSHQYQIQSVSLPYLSYMYFIFEKCTHSNVFCFSIGVFLNIGFIGNELGRYAEGMDGVAAESVAYTATVDHDVARMENLLDQWTTELKKNVMVC